MLVLFYNFNSHLQILGHFKNDVINSNGHRGEYKTVKSEWRKIMDQAFLKAMHISCFCALRQVIQTLKVLKRFLVQHFPVKIILYNNLIIAMKHALLLH